MGSMPRDTTRRVSAHEARRLARIANGKDPDDLSDVYRGRPARRKKLEPIDATSTRYAPAAPLSLADAAAQLGVRPVQLAQAVREGRVATVHGRCGARLGAPAEVERVRGENGVRPVRPEPGGSARPAPAPDTYKVG
jgi:hypothetical protein